MDIIQPINTILCDTNGMNFDELRICKLVGEHLFGTYKGWMWAIQPAKGGGIIIRLLDAPIKGLCMFIHPRHLTTPDQIRLRVVEAGGEMLERCWQRAGKMKEGDVIKKVDGASEKDYLIPKIMRDKL
jgi:hypothetical protein